MNTYEAKNVIAKLEGRFPAAECELNFSTPFELLVAVILSAQCTDKRVNAICAELFKVYNTPQQFADIPQSELEKYIYSAGFYSNKAANIIKASKMIMDCYGGEVPSSQEELIKLAGVGRKTANVVYSVAFGGNAIAVDTHVFRVANRIGLVDAKTPEEVERGLCAIIPEELWSRAHHLLIFQGRYVCHSKNPDCLHCNLNDICKYYKEL